MKSSEMIPLGGYMTDMKGSSSSPTQPRGKNRRVSQRGLLSILMLTISVAALGIAMIGGAKLVHDILNPGSSKIQVFAPMIVLGVAYMVGWLSAMAGIRVYGNLILPILVNIFAWVCLAGVCYLYLEILKRLYDQHYQLANFIRYSFVMIGGLGAMVGLHLILEDHNLRPFAIPLLIISTFQLVMIVYRYVYIGSSHPVYLFGDLTILFGMSLFSMMMLAHLGLLDPLRISLAEYFDNDSLSIRTQD
jgi:hypothetical protein